MGQITELIFQGREISPRLLLPILVLVLAFSASVLIQRIGRNTGQILKHLRPKAILTANELEFYQRLRRALPDFTVLPQISFDALLETSSDIPKRKAVSFRNRFAQKRADFIVCCSDTLEVVAIVELDDRTHSPERDKKRDAMLKAAGYRVERFQSKAKPSANQLADVLGQSIK